MGRMQIISPREIRVICDCGKYVHELERGEDGKIDYQSFVVNVKPPAEPPPEPQPDSKTKKKKPRRFVGFFDEEEEGSEEGGTE